MFLRLMVSISWARNGLLQSRWGGREAERRGLEAPRRAPGFPLSLTILERLTKKAQCFAIKIS